MVEYDAKHVYGGDSFSEGLMRDEAFVEDLLYNDELSFEEAAFLSGYYEDIDKSFS
ncbi:MAG: hypothetical protein ACQESE_04260 [Nanobdellota archaeon]